MEKKLFELRSSLHYTLEAKVPFGRKIHKKILIFDWSKWTELSV